MTDFDFYVFPLDEHHAVGLFSDKSGNSTWQMITTKKPIVDNVIDGGAGFELCEIDQNNFEFNGKRLKIILSRDMLEITSDG